jgi:hypothetical protein
MVVPSSSLLNRVNMLLLHDESTAYFQIKCTCKFCLLFFSALHRFPSFLMEQLKRRYYVNCAEGSVMLQCYSCCWIHVYRKVLHFKQQQFYVWCTSSMFPVFGYIYSIYFPPPPFPFCLLANFSVTAPEYCKAVLTFLSSGCLQGALWTRLVWLRVRPSDGLLSR